MNRNNSVFDNLFEVTVLLILMAILLIAGLMTITGNWQMASNLCLLGIAIVVMTFTVIGIYVVFWGLILDLRYKRKLKQTS